MSCACHFDFTPQGVVTTLCPECSAAKTAAPDDDFSLIESQIDGLLDGEGAGEDHDDVHKFLVASGLSPAIALRVRVALIRSRERVEAMIAAHEATS